MPVNRTTVACGRGSDPPCHATVTNSPSTSETAVQQMPKAGSVLASSASASSASSSRVSLIVFTRLAVEREGGGLRA